jgi:hypothetical protein
VCPRVHTPAPDLKHFHYPYSTLFSFLPSPKLTLSFIFSFHISSNKILENIIKDDNPVKLC